MATGRQIPWCCGVSCLMSLVLSMTVADAADEIGVAVGARAPEFKLADQSGNEQSLSAFLQKGTTALVFFRSADW